MNDRSISEALAPRAEMPLSFQKLELPVLADSLPFGIYTCDTAGTLIQFNRQCETIWGAKPRAGSEGKFSGGAHRLYDIENCSLAPAETPMAEAVRTGKPAPARELIVERPDQTVPSARSPSEFAASFGGRIQTLARTHSLLTENTWQGAELSALLRDQLIVGESGDDRVSYAGPSVMLNPQAALHLSLVLHELATNARKYGALSDPRGKLSIKWMVRTNSERELLLQWQERDGLAVTVPQRRGFGTSLIEKSLEAHGGAASIRYEGEGLTCDITLTLPQSEQSATGSYKKLGTAKMDLNQARLVEKASVVGKRILVVDDEPLIAMDIVSSLEDEGCVVVGPAATLEKALALIDTTEIDAAMLDANLGGKPVDALAAALVRRNIPFAFVSGYGREGLPEAFRQAMLIRKPFQHQRLIEAVQQMVQEQGTVVQLRKNF